MIKQLLKKIFGIEKLKVKEKTWVYNGVTTSAYLKFMDICKNILENQVISGAVEKITDDYIYEFIKSGKIAADLSDEDWYECMKRCYVRIDKNNDSEEEQLLSRNAYYQIQDDFKKKFYTKYQKHEIRSDSIISRAGFTATYLMNFLKSQNVLNQA